MNKICWICKKEILFGQEFLPLEDDFVHFECGERELLKLIKEHYDSN
jgi:hypothetical protein